MRQSSGSCILKITETVKPIQKLLTKKCAETNEPKERQKPKRKSRATASREREYCKMMKVVEK